MAEAQQRVVKGLARAAASNNIEPAGECLRTCGVSKGGWMGGVGRDGGVSARARVWCVSVCGGTRV